MPRTTIRLAWAAGLAASVAALAGCSTPVGADASDGALHVVATTTQMGDVVREIAGDDAEVVQLLQPGRSAHSYDPTPEALAALAEADVLVMNGAGLEEWLDDTIDASGFDGELVDASTDARLHESEAHQRDDDGHDHDGLDPHVWSDPSQVVRMAETIGAALARADAASADALEASTDDYVARLETLDTWVTDSIAQVPVEQRLLVTNHDSFAYLAEAQGITVVGAVMPAFDDAAEPSAADIDALVQAIRDSGVRAVFSETSIDPQLAETIASEAGVEVHSGDDALLVDALGAPGTLGATYVGSVVHNVTRIVESWGVEPLPLPDGLIR